MLCWAEQFRVPIGSQASKSPKQRLLTCPAPVTLTDRKTNLFWRTSANACQPSINDWCGPGADGWCSVFDKWFLVTDRFGGVFVVVAGRRHYSLCPFQMHRDLAAPTFPPQRWDACTSTGPMIGLFSAAVWWTAGRHLILAAPGPGTLETDNFPQGNFHVFLGRFGLQPSVAMTQEKPRDYGVWGEETGALFFGVSPKQLESLHGRRG